MKKKKKKREKKVQKTKNASSFFWECFHAFSFVFSLQLFLRSWLLYFTLLTMGDGGSPAGRVREEETKKE